MGVPISKESQEYSVFLKDIKEAVKSKSMYQYQIAHFKILNIEKKIVPTADYIQNLKIQKIITSKRLADLKKTLQLLKFQQDESSYIAKLKSIEVKLEEKLRDLNFSSQKFLEKENSVKIKTKYLESLESKRKSLTQKSKFLEMKLMKVDYNRRFSIKSVKSIRPLEISSVKKKSFSQFLLNQKLENCDKCLERLEKISLHAIKYHIESYKNKILDLELKISQLCEEKKRIDEINSVDLVKLKNSINLEGILEKINRIRLEIQVLKTEST